MDLYKYKAHELRELIQKKEVSAEEIVISHINRIDEVEGRVGAFLYIAKDEALNKAKEIDKKILLGEQIGDLAGIPIGVKDNISVKSMPNTCGSRMLEDYIAPYDAHVIEKLKLADAVIMGKLNMDEFAMGSSTENSAFKKTTNPWNIERVPGGSSGGSAASVSALELPLALGTETGGSVRQPASFCGVVGLKPTYGRVSRYGAVSFGSTLDQIGTLGRDVEDSALLTQHIAGIDLRDSTIAQKKVPNYRESLKVNVTGKRIGIPKEFFGEGLDSGIRKLVLQSADVLRENGAKIEEFSLPIVDYSLAAYYIISSAEASSNLARFDGIKYGFRANDFEDIVDLYYKSRTQGFGPEVKRRIMLGTYALSSGYYDEYYKKALKVRNLIKQDFHSALTKYDAILAPVCPTTAFKFGEKEDILQMYLSDIYTVPVNIAGLPAISVPCGFIDGLPVGLQLIGNYFREDTLFNLAYSFEKSTNIFKEGEHTWNMK